MRKQMGVCVCVTTVLRVWLCVYVLYDCVHMCILHCVHKPGDAAQ